MEDPFFDDPFLDDLDLFYEGLLSEEDARRMYRRGEITEAQLDAYLGYRQQKQQKSEGSFSNSWVIVFVIIILATVCLCVILSSVS